MLASTRCSPRARKNIVLRGWVLYDGRCRMCRRLVRLFGGVLKRRGFRLAPLQRRWVRDKVALLPHELLSDMRVLTADGWLISGAEAVVHLASFIGWARPLAWASGVPPLMRLMRWGYRLIADHRCRVGGACSLRTRAPRRNHLTRFFDV